MLPDDGTSTNLICLSQGHSPPEFSGELLEFPHAKFSVSIGGTPSCRAVVGAAGKRCGFEFARRVCCDRVIPGGDRDGLGEWFAGRGGALDGFREDVEAAEDS